MTSTLRIGIDLVDVRRIAESIDRFGDRFLTRVFTDQEISYARSSPRLVHQRLAARFAAKEAAVKALNVSDTQPVNWRDIEVCHDPSGGCALDLHGAMRQLGGGRHWSVSISHEGDYATAVVVSCERTLTVS